MLLRKASKQLLQKEHECDMLMMKGPVFIGNLHIS